MSTQNLSAKQINKIVPKKLRLENLQSTRENHGDYYLDGKFQFKVTMPNIHGGSNTVSTGFLRVCRDTVHLTARQYADLVRCPMESEQYEGLIRDKFKLSKKKDK